MKSNQRWLRWFGCSAKKVFCVGWFGRHVENQSWAMAVCCAASSSLNAGFAEREQIGELRFGERRLLAGALQFDEFTGGIHHQIHVHRRAHVLGVTQVQQRRPLTMPTLTAAMAFEIGLSGQVFSRPISFFTASDSATNGTGDGRRARAAVGLQHIAIHADCPFADFFQIQAARMERPMSRWIS
jgi:hypothetical protein